MTKRFSAVVLLLCGLVFSLQVKGQDSATEQLLDKTYERLVDKIEQSQAITGLAVVDLTTSETAFTYNAELVFPQASAIKIPILMEVFKQAGEGKFTLSDKRTVDSENLVGGTGILKHLEQRRYSIRDLCTLMIALSDNSATNSLIDLVGMSEVNAMLRQLGTKETLLQRKMMAIKASAHGEENLSTPAEAVKILQLLYNGDFVDEQTSSDILSILQKPPRRESRIATGLPSDVPVAFKPGGLKGVSTEWAIVMLQERPYAVAVMEKLKLEGSSKHTVEEISEILYDYFWRLGNSTSYGVFRDPDMIK